MSQQVILARNGQTFDLDNLEILHINDKNFVFVKTKNKFLFQGVTAQVWQRSKVSRQDKPHSQIIDYVAGAIVENGFCGHLYYKIKLSSDVDFERYDSKMVNYINECSALHLFASDDISYNESHDNYSSDEVADIKFVSR